MACCRCDGHQMAHCVAFTNIKRLPHRSFSAVILSCLIPPKLHRIAPQPNQPNLAKGQRAFNSAFNTLVKRIEASREALEKSSLVESAHHQPQHQTQPRAQVSWFSALVSREENLPAIYSALKEVGARRVETIAMAQGQKKSRIVAWRFRQEGRTV